MAGARGFDAPADIRGDRITGDGRTFRYVDSESIVSDPARAPAFAALPGRAGGGGRLQRGRDPARARRSARRPRASRRRRGRSSPRWAPGCWSTRRTRRASRRDATQPGGGSLTADEVADHRARGDSRSRNRARGQIRRPLGSPAEVTHRGGGPERRHPRRSCARPTRRSSASTWRCRRRARVLFFSRPRRGRRGRSRSLAAASTLDGSPRRRRSRATSTHAQRFLGDPTRSRAARRGARAPIGNLHRPFYPDGIDGTPRRAALHARSSVEPVQRGLPARPRLQPAREGDRCGDTSAGCAGRLPAGARAGADAGFAKLRNGVQIFPGGVPIYRGDTLVGAIGVSGDGVDQDDMVAFLGLANAGAALGNGIAQRARRRCAPTRSRRMGVRLRYVQCPQAPVQRLDRAECLRGPLARNRRGRSSGAGRCCVGAAVPAALRGAEPTTCRSRHCRDRDRRDRAAAARSERARAVHPAARRIRCRCPRPRPPCRGETLPVPDRWRIMQALGFQFPLVRPLRPERAQGRPADRARALGAGAFPGAGRATRQRLVREPRRRLRHARRGAPAAHAGRRRRPRCARAAPTSSARASSRALVADRHRLAVAHQGRHHLQAAGLRVPPRRRRSTSTARTSRRCGRCASTRARATTRNDNLVGAAGGVRRHAPAQRLGPLRLRLAARRHPALHRRTSAASCSRTSRSACASSAPATTTAGSTTSPGSGASRRTPTRA